jgi:hypothetical protein
MGKNPIRAFVIRAKDLAPSNPRKKEIFEIFSSSFQSVNEEPVEGSHF